MSGIRRKRTNAPAPKSLKKPNTDIDFTLDDLDYETNTNTKTKRRGDDIIESEDEGGKDDASMESSEDEDEKETVDAKRIRMAREYLDKMNQVHDDSSDVASSDEDEDEIGNEGLDEADRLSKRLERQRLKQQGMYERMVASKVQHSVNTWWTECNGANTISTSPSPASPEALAKSWVDQGHVKLFRGHDLTPTCVALHAPSGSIAYSASKDNSILMWDVESQTRMNTIVPRWNPNTCEYTRNSGEVLAMAASDDGRYLAVGGRDATVKIYDVRQKSNSSKAAAQSVSVSSENGNINTTNNGIRGIVTTFEGHKGPVTALAFRSQSLQLFSGSDDRCIRHYNLDEMAYIETLYGHQAGITGISCHGIRHEMPFSVARDRTARAWKLAEETHMIFRGGSKLSNADCISAIKDDYFLTGHDDGVLSFWLKDKKRAVATVKQAHGLNGTLPRGIVSCASLGGSDFAATGSNDGFLRLWQVRELNFDCLVFSCSYKVYCE